jgi:hypothetical protein
MPVQLRSDDSELSERLYPAALTAPFAAGREHDFGLVTPPAIAA